MIKRCVRVLFLVLFFFTLLLPLPGFCEDGQARDITADAVMEAHEGFSKNKKLFDGETDVPVKFADNSWLTLRCPEGIGSIYLIFHNAYGIYTVTDNDSGKTAMLGQNQFLHDYTDLCALFGSAPSSITLSFNSGTLYLNEIYLFSTGEAPDFVQRWEPPADGKADLLLLSAHGDDEQLFFGGIIPYYTGQLGRRVQVVYLTDHHNNNPERRHEMLNGLYACGDRVYPVFGTCRDVRSDTLQSGYADMAEDGVTEQMLVGFAVEQLRRFQPMVVVTHDVEGEYGHSQHMLCADLMMKACRISMDPTEYPELAAKYGVWDVPKTYLHLYPENEIFLDWDVPLSRFDGMTAFEVSRDLGFACHESQYRLAWYYRQGECAKDLTRYSPCAYGLYRSTVGADNRKNDFFENIDSHDIAQRRLALPRRDWKTA